MLAASTLLHCGAPAVHFLRQSEQTENGGKRCRSEQSHPCAHENGFTDDSP